MTTPWYADDAASKYEVEMGGGQLARCTNCGRLVIYGQTCTCGHNTNGQGGDK